MRNLSISPIILTILPATAIIPTLIKVINGFHIGGIKVLIDFFLAAFQPSLDPIVVNNALRGLITTLSIALISWSISSGIGILLGIFTSSTLWKSINLPNWLGWLSKRLLSIPRSIHEVIWGLFLLQTIGLSTWVAVIAIVIPYSAIVGRVVGDQLDALDRKSYIALENLGSNSLSNICTSLLPKLKFPITSYCGYRLECAIRSATLLGIFGLGGIGTELQLSLRSLRFNEMWTSLWLLAGVILLLEVMLNKYRKNEAEIKKPQFSLVELLKVIILLCFISLVSLKLTGEIIEFQYYWHPIPIPTIQELLIAFNQLPIINLVGNTLFLTIIASAIAIGGAPFAMMIWSSKIGNQIQSIIWLILRLIPPPLTALLILLCTSPNIYVGALALGIHNIGIMGRLLKEGIDQQDDSRYQAVISSGASQQIAWLYGSLSRQTYSYLAFSAYRSDVILRETAIVGLVGGTGLGWQLIESLSSFNWAELLIVVTFYSIITMIGEVLTDSWKTQWEKSALEQKQIRVLKAKDLR